MEIRKKVLIAFCLLFGGVVLTEPAVFGASKKGSAKRAKSKSKSKKKDKKSKKKGITGTVSTPVASTEVRASSSALRAVSSTTTTSSSSSTAVDEATEISNLTANLMSCLSQQCSGQVDYEKCFKTSNIDLFLASNSSCQDYLNAASSDTVRVSAKNAVVSRIKGYLNEACETAGGKVNGATCQFTIFYYAKSADGKHSTKRQKTVNMGQTFNCSYQTFGMSAQDLEYKEDMTSDQKIALFQAGIEGGMGLLNAGAQGFSALKASKELKKKDHLVKDGWYKFDGKTLSPIKQCYEYDYGASGIGKDKELEGCNNKVQDSNGVTACKKDLTYNNGDNCMKELSESEKNGMVECSSVTEANLDDAKFACYVQIERKTELQFAEKQNELARSTGYLDNLKSKAEAGQRTNQIQQWVGTVAMGQLASGLGNANFLAKDFGASSGSSSGSKYCNRIPERFVLCNVTNPYRSPDGCVTGEVEARGKLSGNYKCANIGGYITCYPLGADGDDDCEFVNNNWQHTGSSSTAGGIPSAESLSKMKENADDNTKNLMGAINVIDGMMKGNDEANNNIKSYNSALSSYSSNQNSLNEKKKELQDLKEASSTSLNTAISTGSQAVFTAGTNIATQLMNAKNNKGTMTGACYIGDPSRGNMFLQDGQAKKLEWKLFN